MESRLCELSENESRRSQTSPFHIGTPPPSQTAIRWAPHAYSFLRERQKMGQRNKWLRIRHSKCLLSVTEAAGCCWYQWDLSNSSIFVCQDVCDWERAFCLFQTCFFPCLELTDTMIKKTPELPTNPFLHAEIKAKVSGNTVFCWNWWDETQAFSWPFLTISFFQFIIPAAVNN